MKSCAEGLRQRPEVLRMKIEFDHIGIPTDTPQPDEFWVAQSKVWVTNPRTHPLRIEYLRFIEKPAIDPAQVALWKLWNMPHIAYRVEDLDQALAGQEVVYGPFEPADFGPVAFIHKDGAILEYMQYTNPNIWFGQPTPWRPAGPTRRAFTLVELLVVVAVVTVLLALLAPALDKAVEQAERTLCASNQRHTTVAMNQYAIDMKQKFPDGQPAYRSKASSMNAVDGRRVPTAGMGSAVIWAQPPEYDDYGGYLGHGIVGYLRYADPRSFYCPSMTIPWMRYNTTTDTATKVGGWPASNDPRAESYDYVVSPYQYRAVFQASTTWRAPNLSDPAGAARWRPATLRADAGHEPILADIFSEPTPAGTGRNVNQHHRDGYNVARIGGGVGFIPDPERKVYNWNNGQTYYAGEPEFALQQQVWEEFFARR